VVDTDRDGIWFVMLDLGQRRSSESILRYEGLGRGGRRFHHLQETIHAHHPLPSIFARRRIESFELELFELEVDGFFWGSLLWRDQVLFWPL
jgi:hypothetical protein